MKLMLVLTLCVLIHAVAFGFNFVTGLRAFALFNAVFCLLRMWQLVKRVELLQRWRRRFA